MAVSEVIHGEDAAVLDEEVAGLQMDVEWAERVEQRVQESRERSWPQAAALSDAHETHPVEPDSGTTVDDSEAPAPCLERRFSTIMLLEFTRHPRAFTHKLLRGEDLRELREALWREGRDCNLPGGAKILVPPADYAPAMRATVGMRLHPSHVITSEEYVPVVLAAVNELPHRANVRLRSLQVLAYSYGQGEGTVVVRHGFLNLPAPLRDAQVVVNSTTEAHRGQNPRRPVV